MKPFFALIVLGAALSPATTALALPTPPIALFLTGPATDSPLLLVDSDEDEDDDDEGGWFSGDDDDDDDDEGCGNDDEEGGADCTTQGSPAPAGTVAPPANGLFTNGTAPKAQTN